MVALGRFWDRLEWRHGARGPSLPARPAPWRSIFIVGAICLGLIGATVGLRLIAGFGTALALMIVAPTVTLIWFLFQNDDATNSRPLARIEGFGPLLRADAPDLARSAVALGLSGFIGRALAEVVPIEGLGLLIQTANLPGWLVLAALPVLISLGGQVAISPIMLVVFLGQVLGTIPDLPLSDTLIVYALSIGWALSMLTSPNATATLLISATTKIPPTRLTWAWNLKYALATYAVFVAIFIVLA